ncbi:hypothetical protein FKM82_009770 [Ascaphus truei]
MFPVISTCRHTFYMVTGNTARSKQVTTDYKSQTESPLRISVALFSTDHTPPMHAYHFYTAPVNHIAIAKGKPMYIYFNCDF